MPRPLYESETTQFLRDLLRKQPEIAEQQRVGRAMWWDRRQDRDQRGEFESARVPKKPYEYY